MQEMTRIRQLYNKSNKIAKCLSCDLCNQLLKDATKIIECFHTFCKECIHSKIEEEELECCPVCDIDLGPDPFTKMRADISLQNMRNHLFPIGKEKEAYEYLPKVLMKANGYPMPKVQHFSTSSSTIKRKLKKSKGTSSSEKHINKKMKIEDEAQDNN
ncbi:unnamed protein product [Vicia faba]|uniref:RING-type domain-containing protein n=1 Tax=Vicia faba TaxID=3906 RepID=A0AAV1A3C9_VICFA|nr:unnamed protein product [Vicia faba]